MKPTERPKLNKPATITIIVTLGYQDGGDV